MTKHSVTFEGESRDVEASLNGYFNQAIAWDLFGEELPYKLVSIQTETGTMKTWIHNDDTAKLPKVNRENPITVTVTLNVTKDITGRVGHEYLGEQQVITGLKPKDNG